MLTFQNVELNCTTRLATGDHLSQFMPDSLESGLLFARGQESTRSIMSQFDKTKNPDILNRGLTHGKSDRSYGASTLPMKTMVLVA